MVFGGPQDIEWALAEDGTLWLLQSRPLTTELRGTPRGPIYGPGPVAETFPEPLTELEYDLWVPPLRDAVREAVLLSGAATHAEIDASEIVIAVDGHVAIDLRLAGEVSPKHGLLQKLNPIPAAHRLRGAWRVGRLRAALPRLAEHLLDRVDADLEAVPALSDLTSRQLIALLHRSRAILRALHAHEILMGMLTDTGRNRMTGASVALRVLVEARQDGLSDADILSRSPVVLALTPPRVAPAPVLPADASAIHLGRDEDSGNDNGILREALRLRVRWMQEVSGRAAWELGNRLTLADQLTEPELIRHMTLEHVEAVATKRAVVIPALVATHFHEFGSPLPAAFQISDRGKVIRAQTARRGWWRHRRGRWRRQWTGHLRHRESAGRFGARHHDTATGARSPAHPAQRHRRRNRFRPVAPRDPCQGGAYRDGGGLRRRIGRLARGCCCARRRREWTGHHPRRGDIMKVIAWLAGISTLLTGALYMIVSLNRWEWTRALFFGLIVLIAEVGLATGVVLRRLTRLEHSRTVDRAIAEILRETRPTRDRFAWLKRSAEQSNVFITFLVGGGVLLSGIAWVVDRVAAKTSSPAGEQRLASDLAPISYPPGGLLLDDITVLAQDVPGADDVQIRKLLRRAGH